MSYRVVFAPEATDQLTALYRYISDASSPATAYRYTNGIVEHCEGLVVFPHRGTPRDDIRPGLRVTNFKKRTVIAFAVMGDIVAILGIYYGGQDFEALLQDET